MTEHDADRTRFATKVALDKAIVAAIRVHPGESRQKLDTARRYMEAAIAAFGEAKLHAHGAPAPGPVLTARGVHALQVIGRAQDRLEAYKGK